ncbi:hypothetical protein OUZ56_007362 [Daphnia magna]|uniref:Uncharacterized protein n=1 Tax=Daphnia magna TaxID=35525 RepID=A0ABR0A9Q3_9CRUS|nr:hypothetical protein OUZ56_007362 [Daphnia magna]
MELFKEFGALENIPFLISQYKLTIRRKKRTPVLSGYPLLGRKEGNLNYQLGLHETVSKGRDRHRYIPEGLFRPCDWPSPSPHPKAHPPLLLMNYCELSPMGNWVGAGRRKTFSRSLPDRVLEPPTQVPMAQFTLI